MRKIKRTKDQCFICGKSNLLTKKGKLVEGACWVIKPDGTSVLVCIEHPGVKDLE